MVSSMKRTGLSLRLASGLLVLLVALAAVGLDASAQAYPTREIQHIIPWGAGGGTDAAMRGFMRFMEKHIGTTIVTQNIPGANSALGMIQLKQSRPDGYTIGTMTYDILTVEFQGLAPVSWRDFEILGMVTNQISTLQVLSARYNSLEEFIADAKARPGQVRIGNVGTGTGWHQHAAAMAEALGIEVRHIPYEGGAGPQLAALLGGEVDAIVATLTASLGHIADGTIKVLGVMDDERDPAMPDVPTFAEQGYPELLYGNFRLVVAPKGVPADRLAKLREAVDATWHDPEFQAWAKEAAIGASWRNHEDAAAYMESMAPRVQNLMRQLGLAD